MRRALALALAALLSTTAVVLAATPPQKQASELVVGARPPLPMTTTTEAAAAPVPPPAPLPAPAAAAAPSVPPLAPVPPPPPPPTDATSSSSSSNCCSALEKAGFKRTPGVPVIILTTTTTTTTTTNSTTTTTTTTPPRLDTREKTPVVICACDDENTSIELPGLARVRGGVNTQRYNTIKQFAIYPDFFKGEKKSEKKTGSDVGVVVKGDNNSSSPSPPSSSSSTFLGLPLGNQFVLIGQVNDTFSMKYWTGLELASRMSSKASSKDALVVPKTRHVELFVVDGDAAAASPLVLPPFDVSSPQPPPQQYRGVYLMTQHIDPALILGMKRPRGEKKKENNNNNKNKNSKLSPGAFVSTFLHGERIDPSFSAFVEMPVTNAWAGKNKEWAVKYPDSKDVELKMGNGEGRALLDSVARRYAAVEGAIFSKKGSSPADFDSPSKLTIDNNNRNGSNVGVVGVGVVDAAAFERAAHVPSWLDWFLLAELTKVTKHAYHSAAFMHSLGDGVDGSKLRFGPVWSQGQGFGTCCGYPVEGFRDGGSSKNPSSSSSAGFSGGGGTTPNGFLFTLCLVDGLCPSLDGYDRGNGFSPWFVALFFDPANDFFARAAAARWAELRGKGGGGGKGPWSDDAISSMLQERAKLLSEPGQRALARWPALRGEATKAAERIGKGKGTGDEKGSGGGDNDNGALLVSAVGGAIERWLLERARWLDRAFEQASGPSRNAPYPVSYA